MTHYSIIYRAEDSTSRCVQCGENEVGKGLAGWRQEEEPAPYGVLCTNCLMEAAPVLGTVLASLDVFHELGAYNYKELADEIMLMAVVLESLRQFRVFADQHWQLDEQRISLVAKLEEEVHRLEELHGPLWQMPELPSEERHGLAQMAWAVRSLEAKYFSILVSASDRQS